MPAVKSRREMYAEATRAAIIQEGTTLFAERGFKATSLDDVASAAQVTRGAVYHHFAGKQDLFEAVVEAQELRMNERIRQSITEHGDAWDGAMAAIDTFLETCLDPTYSKIVWQEGMAALGWSRLAECEERYAMDTIVLGMEALIAAGYVRRTPALDTTLRFIFHLFGTAGLLLAEAEEASKARVKDECAEVMKRMIIGLRMG